MDKTLRVLKAMADRNRMRVVLALTAAAELCACQITELLGITGASASRHLSLLVAAEILRARKDGRWMHYRLADDASSRPLLAWVVSRSAGSPEHAEDMRKLAAITACDREEICRRQRCGAEIESDQT